jgi:hypothetical protein
MRINECSCGCGGDSDKCMEKGGSDLNYMFFGNLETIKRMIDELVQMDHAQIDEIIKDGHEWAVDHVASSADDIQEVYNFLKNRAESPTHSKRDQFAEDDMMVKTFESYVNEVSGKKWKEIETDLRGRKMDVFADRVSAHSKQYGTNQVTEVKLVGIPTSGYERETVFLSVTDLELRQKAGSQFKIVGKDSDWGTVVINGFTTSAGSIQMFESDRMPLLAADRKNAMELIKFLVDEGVVYEKELDWRRFTNGYVSFKEAYKL